MIDDPNFLRIEYVYLDICIIRICIILYSYMMLHVRIMCMLHTSKQYHYLSNPSTFQALTAGFKTDPRLQGHLTEKSDLWVSCPVPEKAIVRELFFLIYKCFYEVDDTGE